jgi:hypothetical protein
LLLQKAYLLVGYVSLLRGREVVVIMHEPFRASSSAEKICHNNFVVDEED